MFPKKIWRLWNQGWKNAPYVVRHCTDFIYHYAPDWEIIHLDESNISDYMADYMADYIELPEKINSGKTFMKSVYLENGLNTRFPVTDMMLLSSVRHCMPETNRA